jgi:hypothetical protein
MKYLSFCLFFLVSPIVNAYSLAPTTPGKWGDPVMGTGATISYSFMSGGETCDQGTCSSLSSFMPTGFKAEIEKAFDTWSSVANLTFLEVTDDGADWNAATNSGDIRFAGEYFDGISGTLAHGYYPPNNGDSAAGDIHFDTSEFWSIDGVSGTFSIYWVALHEIGHALGLGHSSVTTSIMTPYYDSSITGLDADDIAGIQYIYGARDISPVPVPAAFWLFSTVLIGFMGFRQKMIRTKNNAV